jgi:hypothetical protein
MKLREKNRKELENRLFTGTENIAFEKTQNMCSFECIEQLAGSGA